MAQNAFNSECKRTQGIFPQIILKTWGENSLFLPAVFQFLKRILNLYFSHHTFLLAYCGTWRLSYYLSSSFDGAITIVYFQ